MTAPDFKKIVAEIYDMLSGPPGPRDYERVRRYYHPDARLVRTGMTDDGAPFSEVMTLDDHAAGVAELLRDQSFDETEIAHEASVFGSVAVVKSLYTYQFGEGDDAVSGRGINLFTFYHDGDAWRIISCVWNNERDGFSLTEAIDIMKKS
ncbi:MAG: nuclear transport factor 2 family protein [Pseudomonadota bacterium]